MQFKELNIIPEIRKALEKENYSVPTPIQEKAIPCILSGSDLIGCAQTGTGKTAAFAIPTLQLLSEDKTPGTADRKIRALIITPTRELALQIYESFCTYGKYTKMRSCVIFGGVSQKPQEESLQQGVDILVATPGRLNDLIGQKLIDLRYIKIFILDEADRMLDMGFINDINKIIAKIPVNKQTLLFSATMPADVAKLANDMLTNPVKIKVTPVSSTVDTIEQYVYYVDKNNKKDLLVHLLKDKTIKQALVFTRTKHGADRIVRQLIKDNVPAQAIHGDKSQGARQNALNDFKNKKLRVLIATDIAARGIDIDELSHVINYDLPNIPETYVHRIGRTGRAGLGGVAISFCDFDEKEQLADIENLTKKRLNVVKDHPYPLVNNFPAQKTTQPRRDKKHSETPMNDSIHKTIRKSDVAREKALPRVNSRKITTKQTGTSPNKKYRMTADGTLKEKRSFSSFSRKGKKETGNSKRKNNKTY
jgi:ATP-dependent RNA helicase RhlE